MKNLPQTNRPSRSLGKPSSDGVKWFIIIVASVSLAMYLNGHNGIGPFLFVLTFFSVLFLLQWLFPKWFKEWLG